MKTTKRTPRKTGAKRTARTGVAKHTRRKATTTTKRVTARGTKAEKVAAAARKSGIKPPYNNKGRSNFAEYKGKSGVYIIRENGKVVYIGYSGVNLYKTMHRHFEAWTAKQYVVTYKGNRKKYTVQVFRTAPAKAGILEQALIAKYRPRDNDKTPSFEFYKKNAPATPAYVADPPVDLPF